MTFNEVLWNDLKFAGVANLVGKSLYPKTRLADPASLKYDEWANDPVKSDYVAFGSVFPSPTKPAAVRAPLALFGEARSLGVPLVAIGGITLQNAPQLLAAGADCLAVISDLFEAPDIAEKARAYAMLFKS